MAAGAFLSPVEADQFRPGLICADGGVGAVAEKPARPEQILLPRQPQVQQDQGQRAVVGHHQGILPPVQENNFYAARLFSFFSLRITLPSKVTYV